MCLSSASRPRAKERIAFLKAVANMIASDHKITEDETADLYQLVLAAGLSPLDETIEKEVLPELDSPGDIKAILADIESAELKNNLFRILIEVAAADGEIADGERERVLDAAGSFGLNRDAAGELLEWTCSSIKHEEKEAEILQRLGTA